MKKNFIKKLISHTYLLLGLCSLLNAQDKQWYIKNGKVNTIHVQDTNISTNFKIDSLSYPCLQCNNQARKDLFIIFNDYSHFNSRNLDSQWTNKFKHITNPFNYKKLCISFYDSNTTTSIQSAYLTNGYQDDDPPELLKIAPSSPVSSEPTYNINLRTNTNNVLSANHDITPQSDFTIIIKNEFLKNKAQSTIKESKIIIDRLINFETNNNNPTPPLPNNFFVPSPIFGTNNYIFSQNNVTSDTQFKTFFINGQSSSNYTYINIRPAPNYSNAAASYFSDATGKPKYKLVIKAYDKNGNCIDSLIESLRAAHDPNYVSLLKITNESGVKRAYYHAEFQNTSLTPVSNPSIRLAFPSTFDTGVVAIRWKFNNSSITPSSPRLIKIENDSAYYQFDFMDSYQACMNPVNIDMSIGYVEFSIKIKDSNLDYSKPSFSFEPGDRYTKFDGTKYPIDNFYDKIEYCYKTNKTYRVLEYDTSDHCKCSLWEWIKYLWKRLFG